MTTDNTETPSTCAIPTEVGELGYAVTGLYHVEGKAMAPRIKDGDLAAIVDSGLMTPETPALVKLTNGSTFTSFVHDSEHPDFLMVDDMQPKATTADLMGRPIRLSEVESIHPIVGVLRRCTPSRKGSAVDLGEGREWVWMDEPLSVSEYPEAVEACRVVVSGELTDLRVPVAVRIRFPRAFGVRILAASLPPYRVGDIAIVCPDCAPESIENAVPAAYLETAEGGDVCFARDAGDHYVAGRFRGEAAVRIPKADVIRRGVPLGILRPILNVHCWIDCNIFNPDVRTRDRLTEPEALKRTGGEIVRLPE
jgi:hypothetical protein